MAASVLKTLAGIVTKPRVVREAALFVDLAISLALAVYPGSLGWVICVVFFLLRDVSTVRRRSPGKNLYKLRIVKVSDGSPVDWRMTVVRNLILLTPVLNVVDVCYFVKHARRLSDVWLKFDVVPDAVDVLPDGGDSGANPPTAD